MADSGAQTIKGVIDQLKATSAVTDLVSTRIFTRVPQDSTFPYVHVGLTAEEYSAKDFTGMEHNLRVQAFSRKNSPKEVLDVRQAVYNSLNRNESNVTIAGFSLVSLHQEGLVDLFQENDEKTWHAVLDFRVVVTS